MFVNHHLTREKFSDGKTDWAYNLTTVLADQISLAGRFNPLQLLRSQRHP
jgi:hypothetical protein